MKFSNTVLSSLFALSLLSSSCVVVTAADKTRGVRRRLDDDDDSKKKKKKGPSKRKCELETKGDDKVEFECKSETEDATTEIEDKIKFKVSHDNRKGLKVKVEYEQETEVKRRRRLQQDGDEEEDGDADVQGDGQADGQGSNTIQETEIETSYEVTFDRIIEYRIPVNSARRRLQSANDQAYDWEADEIVSEMSLSDWKGFTEVDVSNRRRRLQTGQEVEDTVYTFSLATFDDVATFDFTIAQAGDENAAVTANKMKIDVRLTNYPWAADDTYVAILSNVESEREVEIEYSDEKEDDKDEPKEEKEPPEEEGEQGEDDRRTRRLKKRRESEEVIISFDDALSSTGVMPFGEYTWAKDAQVTLQNVDTDNSALNNDTSIALMQYEMPQNETQTIQVVATSPPDGSDRLAFSFVGSEAAHRAPEIYWDPETGINYAESSATTTFLLTGGMALGVAAAMALMGW